MCGKITASSMFELKGENIHIAKFFLERNLLFAFSRRLGIQFYILPFPPASFHDFKEQSSLPRKQMASAESSKQQVIYLFDMCICLFSPALRQECVNYGCLCPSQR